MKYTVVMHILSQKKTAASAAVFAFYIPGYLLELALCDVLCTILESEIAICDRLE